MKTEPYFQRRLAFDEKAAVKVLREVAKPLHSAADLSPLYDRIGDAKIVMLGEASHGTHEYYSWRARISKYLIEEKGFNFIAVEGDWPDCYTVNRHIKGYPDSQPGVTSVLTAFNRWPTWMWANWEMVALLEWMKSYNAGRAADRRAGFYGLDVYSLWESLSSIIAYLEKTDPTALPVAREAFQCFELHWKDEKRGFSYRRSLVPELCEAEVIDLLSEIRRKLPTYNTDYENVFSAEQNALVAVNANGYYQAMLGGGGHSWNVRDRHMMDTLTRLLTFHGENAKGIVWAHNTHIGDARATDMVDEGLYNIGELARIAYGEKDVVLVGFGSFSGTVMAGNSWGSAMKVMPLPKARIGSWEYLLHETNHDALLLHMDELMQHDMWMEQHLGHRAVGVVYDPSREHGNYVPSLLPLRYDAFVYVNESKALHPLHLAPDGHQVPETYPFGV